MKLEVGKRYITGCGRVTTLLQVSSSSIEYPLYDGFAGNIYAEDGRCANGSHKDTIVALYHDPAPTEKPYAIDTVTISLERYDRFVAIEKALKEIYTEAKKHL